MHEWIQPSLPRLHPNDVRTLLQFLLLEEKINVSLLGSHEHQRNSGLNSFLCDHRSNSVHKLSNWNDISDQLGSISHLLCLVDDDNDLNQHDS